MFRPSDERRVQAAFDRLLPAPFEADIYVEEQRTVLRVEVLDPDDPSLPVASARWTYDAQITYRKQPSDDEIEEIAASIVEACNRWPEDKARNAAEKAAREARQAAHLDARRIDEEARAEAERRVKSAAARALAAPEITDDHLETLHAAVSDPALG